MQSGEKNDKKSRSGRGRVFQMWGERAQMQGVSTMEKSSASDKATKDTPTEGASMLCKRRSTGKKVEESREREGSACGQAMRSVAEGVGKKPGAHFMTKGTGTLWEGHT